MATTKATNKPRSADNAPAKRGPGRPRKAESEARQHAHKGRVRTGATSSPSAPLGRGLSELLQGPRVIHGTHIVGEPVPPPAEESTPAPTIDDAIFELLSAIEGMALLTDDESEALSAVLWTMPPNGSEPPPPEPKSKLAAQIADAARRIEKCNAYRRARLARIDLPRG